MLRRAALVALLTACSSNPSDETGSTTAGPSTGASDDATADAPTAAGEATSSPTAATDASQTGAPTTAPTTGADETSTGGAAVDYNAPGPHPVGNARFTLQAGDRALPVELWYPADPSAAAAAAQGHPIEEFVPAGPDRDAMLGYLADLSPHGQIGTRLQTSSAFEAPPAGAGPWPLLVFSHCHNCVRFSAFSTLERLASHGFIVAAPDHVGNTLFDQQEQVGEEFLVVRVADMTAVLDAVLDPTHPDVPADLRGLADPARVGALGHSFGALTTGRLAQNDPRIKAAFPIAAPLESPLSPDTHMADIHVPLAWILAVEDNSILQIGNNILVDNFNKANPPARLISVADAGHWGFSDICGLVPMFDAGCGEGTRQSKPGEAFTYLDVAVGREIAASYSTAFFDRWLRDNPDADAFLDAPNPAEVVTLESRL